MEIFSPFCFMDWNVETVTLMSASFAILPPGPFARCSGILHWRVL